MTPKLRLLLVTDAVGGVWVYSLELAHALKPLGIETILAVTGPSPSVEQRKAAAGFRLIDSGLALDWLETSPSEIRAAGTALAKIADQEGADVVQTCSAALLADADFSQPCVAVQHSCVASWWAAVKGTPLPYSFVWRRELVECGLNRAAAVVAPTIAFAAETARIYGIHPPVAVHNGRRSSTVPTLPQGDFALTVSRLWDEGKNAATLDLAAARLAIPFEAAGPQHGPNGARIELRHMRGLGEVSPTRLAALLAARPVFASAALYEPFGLSALEAAQAGCALVLSDISTHRELWDGAAIFIEPRDELGFAAASNDLLETREERERLGEAARERARQYSSRRMAREMAGIYTRVLQPQQQLAGAA
jgi:glycosyltransferase involved in cell wall biosynthesis